MKKKLIMDIYSVKSDNLIFYGTYERNIGIYGEYYKIRIKRVQCKYCERTHALLPTILSK